MPDEKTTIKINDEDVVAVINLQQVVKGEEDHGITTGKVYYDVNKQSHSNWLVIDLETGSRGWYPGKQD